MPWRNIRSSLTPPKTSCGWLEWRHSRLHFCLLLYSPSAYIDQPKCLSLDKIITRLSLRTFLRREWPVVLEKQTDLSYFRPTGVWKLQKHAKCYREPSNKNITGLNTAQNEWVYVSVYILQIYWHSAYLHKRITFPLHCRHYLSVLKNNVLYQQILRMRTKKITYWLFKHSH